MTQSKPVSDKGNEDILDTETLLEILMPIIVMVASFILVIVYG